MPIVDVKLYDTRINEETVPKLIEKITDAVCECTTQEIRNDTHVIVEGIPKGQWGTGGKPHG